MRDIILSIEGEWRRYKALGEGAFRQLRDDELGKSGPGGGNSVAIIVWHIAGNLNSRFTDFLNSDGEKPWRNRDSEFQPREGISRAEALGRRFISRGNDPGREISGSRGATPASRTHQLSCGTDRVPREGVSRRRMEFAVHSSSEIGGVQPEPEGPAAPNK